MSLKIRNADAKKPEVLLYGVIGDDFGGVTPKMLRDELAAIDGKKPITLHIHSEGGSFFDGVAMHAMLRQRAGGVDVVVDGLAASAASLVAMAGRTITMSQHAWMMIHEAHAAYWGRAADFLAAAERLEATNDEIVKIYSDRWNGDAVELRAALDAETWLDSEAAVTAGLADGVSEALAVAASISDRFGYKKVPPALFERAPGVRSDAQARRYAELELLLPKAA